jgi:hypothetical protein
MLWRSSRRTWAVGFSVASGAGRLAYSPATLARSSRIVSALGFTMVPAEDWLPYRPAMLWCRSRSVWALGLMSVRVAGVCGAVSRPVVVVR